MDVETLIIGAGLSGLHTAYELEKLGHDYLLVEARNRIGGRVLSQAYPSDYDANVAMRNELVNRNESAYDLGPSWFWPRQTRLENLARDLDLTSDVFEQYSQGSSLFEDAEGNVEKNMYGMSMQGSYRLRGGIHQFITGLASRIPDRKIMTESAVTILERKDRYIKTSLNQSGKPKSIRCKKVVLALPPRNALTNIQFDPSLKASRISELNSFPTWMATQTKFVAVYEKPFWREQGYSGDAMSQRGPLREIHDASTVAGSDANDTENRSQAHYALFGFVGVPVSYRKDNQQQIIDLCIQQLKNLFGDGAATPLTTSWIDWSEEQFTSSPEDLLSGGHADHTLKQVTEWDQQIIWSGTETAEVENEHNNGYLEGALESSLRTIDLINNYTN